MRDGGLVRDRAGQPRGAEQQDVPRGRRDHPEAERARARHRGLRHRRLAVGVVQQPGRVRVDPVAGAQQVQPARADPERRPVPGLRVQRGQQAVQRGGGRLLLRLGRRPVLSTVRCADRAECAERGDGAEREPLEAVAEAVAGAVVQVRGESLAAAPDRGRELAAGLGTRGGDQAGGRT